MKWSFALSPSKGRISGLGFRASRISYQLHHSIKLGIDGFNTLQARFYHFS